MNSLDKLAYQGYLLEYIKKLNPNEKVSEKKLCKCPLNCSEKATAQVNKENLKCFNTGCNFSGDIFALVQKTKPALAGASDDDIADYLKHCLKIELRPNLDILLANYHKAGFAIFPLKKSNPENPKEGKEPVAGFMWTEKNYTNPVLWKEWVQDRGYGLALKLGKDSNVIAIDIDGIPTYEKVKALLGDTKHQKTKRGYGHLLYNYDPDFDNIQHRNFRAQGYEMEVRANNSYIAIAPTSVEGELRQWNDKQIIDMPPALKKFILDLCNTSKEPEKPADDIQKSITENNLSDVRLTGLDGMCNDYFIKFGGVLRKKCNSEQVAWALTHLNQMLAQPMDKKTIWGMCQQIEKYQHYDKAELSKIVLNRLDIIKEGSAFQISKSLNYEQKDIEEILSYLEKEGKIINFKGNRYRKLEDVEWVTGYADEKSKPLTFEVPFFSKYALFNNGNMIIVGGKTGTGKSTLSANIIEKFYSKGEVDSIDLISTESGSNIGNVLEALKVPSSFVFRPKTHKHPMEIEIRDNRVTLIDWVKPKEGDWSQLSNTMQHFHDQLIKHGGFLILLIQLRDDKDGTFFAKDMTSEYSALTAKFLYKDNNNLNPYFQTTKIRSSKTGRQYITVPLKYDFTTKKLEETND